MSTARSSSQFVPVNRLGLGAVLACLLALVLAPSALGAPSHAELSAVTGTFTKPCGVATDSLGNIYVSENNGVASKLKVFDSAGTILVEKEGLGGFGGTVCDAAVNDLGIVLLRFGTGVSTQVLTFTPSEYPPTGSTTYTEGFTTFPIGTTSLAVDSDSQDILAIENVAEKQTITFVPTWTNGDTFTLECDGTLTDPIVYSSTAATRAANIRTELEDECGSGNFAVSNAAAPVVTFQGKKFGVNEPSLNCTTVSGAGSCSITAETNGSSQIGYRTSAGAAVSTVVGPTAIAGAAYYSADVHGVTGNVYATDLANDKVYVFDESGALLKEVDGSSSGQAFGDLRTANLAVDQGTGNVLVSDIRSNGVVKEFNAGGVFVTSLAHTPAFEESEPSDIAVDSSPTVNNGKVYIGAAAGAAGGVFVYGPLAPKFALSVTTSGEGSVTSSLAGVADAGIDCGADCAQDYAEGTEVELEAAPEAGWVLAEWTGACSGSGACAVTMSEAKSVGAVFFEPAAPTATTEAADPVGETTATLNGTVNPNGDEVTTCEFKYGTDTNYGDSVDCVPSPGDGTEGVAVSADVSGLTAGTTYHFQLVAENSLGEDLGDDLTFEPKAMRSLTITLAGSGSGSVSCDGGACATQYVEGTTVTLAAAAAANSDFAGWSGGGCAGTGSCEVTVSEDTSVTATFNLKPSGGGGDTGGGDTGGGDTGGGGDNGGAQAKPGMPKVAGVAAVSANKAALRIACRGGGACKGVLKLIAKLKQGKKLKRVVIGKARYNIAAGKSKTIRVRIANGAAKRMLRRGRIVKATLSGKGLRGAVKLKPAAKRKAKRNIGRR